MAGTGSVRGDAPAPPAASRVASALTPPLAAVLWPWPRLASPDMDDKLAWMAELGRRIDRKDHHSSSRAWRQIMHWPEPGDTLLAFDHAAPDTSLRRYPVPAGRADPAIDFAASVALGWLDARHFSCDFPLRARYLARHDLIPTPTPFDAGKCKAFERWADLESVQAVDVVYVTPSWSDASASMGHVIFRIRHAGSQRVTDQSQDPVIAYAAIDRQATTSAYLLKGLTGGLTASLKVEALGTVYRRYGIEEARDLVHYELVLSRDERRYLLGEVHAELRQKVAVPYAFLSVNCASLAYDLMASVLPELPDRKSLFTHPHEVVSRLLEARRATPKAVLPSRYTRAALAERRLDALMQTMPGGLSRLPGLARLEAQRTGSVTARHDAIVALDKALGESALDPGEARALARYLDLLIDVETWAFDRRDPPAKSPALDAASELRRRLPRLDDDGLLPLKEAALTPSGSRARAVQLGLAGLRPLLRLRLAVLDEATGEPRVILLRRGGRVTVLQSTTALAFDHDTLVLEEERLVLFDTATWGLGPLTELGWWRAHLGFHFGVEALMRPRQGLDFALRVRGGLGLTLAASPDFADHLVVGASIEGGTWRPGLADVRLGAGLFVETGLALGDQRLRATLRALPGWAFPAGFAWAVEASLSLDLVLARDLGLMLEPALTVHWDLPVADGWEVVLGLSW